MQVKVSAKERLEILKKGLGQSMAKVQTGMSSVSSCIGEAATMLSKKVILTQDALHDALTGFIHALLFFAMFIPARPFVAPQFVDVSPERLSDEIAAVFARVDEDGNGNLDRGEFRLAMTMILGRRMKEEEVDVLLCDFDVDGNGLISPQEFEHLVRWSLKVPCLSTCEICESQLRKQLHGNLSEPEPRSEFQPAPPPISRPQTAQRMRCKNFERCGFEGPLRVVAAHELDCGLVRHAGHSISGPLLKIPKTPQSQIILPPIAASLSPQVHLGLQRVSSAPGPFVGPYFGSSIDGVTDGGTRPIHESTNGEGFNSAPGRLLERNGLPSYPDNHRNQELFGGGEDDQRSRVSVRAQLESNLKLASPNMDMEAISPSFPQPASGEFSRTPSDSFTRTASDSSVHSGFSRRPSAGLGFSRAASNSSNMSNESLSQAERVRKLGLLISMRCESIS
jgi:hypothetical protein